MAAKFYLPKSIARLRVIDLCGTLIVATLVMIFMISQQFSQSADTFKPALEAEPRQPGLIQQQAVASDKHEAEPVLKRRKRSSGIPSDPYPITLWVPSGGCTTYTPLTDFPEATCISVCSSSDCTNSLSDIQNGGASLACTARVILLGYKKTSSYSVSKWLSQHPKLTYKYGGLFLKNGQVNYDTCPDAQIADSSTDFYLQPYSLDSIGQDQNTYYVHCENCMTTSYADINLGTLFVDLPTMHLPYINGSEQRFIVTLKNPTDRLIADYFYSYIANGTDLSGVGGQVLHQLMVDALDDVNACISSIGPSACVFGAVSGDETKSTSSVRKLIYDGCYYIHIVQLFLHVPQGQTYFVKSEEFSADPVTVMTNVYNFIGLEFAGEAATTGTSTSKPILQDTISLLDSFYLPYREELSTLLGDEKWKFTRT